MRAALLAATLWAARLPAQSDTTGGFHTAADGTRIHYTVAGAGPAVVLLHGFLNDGASWRRAPAYARLVDAGFRVVVVDLRGNGASDKPTAPAAWANDAETRDVIGLAQALKLGEYCVAGYSRGSIVAARLLELDPRVRCAVLGGMGADFTNPEWPRRVAAHRALAGLPLDSAALAPVAGMVRAAEQRGLDRRVLAMQQQAQPSSSPAALGKVRVPVLVISGDADQEDGSPQELARLFPRATLVTVPGDHSATMRSAAFADSVMAFLVKARH